MKYSSCYSNIAAGDILVMSCFETANDFYWNDPVDSNTTKQYPVVSVDLGGRPMVRSLYNEGKPMYARIKSIIKIIKAR